MRQWFGVKLSMEDFAFNIHAHAPTSWCGGLFCNRNCWTFIHWNNVASRSSYIGNFSPTLFNRRKLLLYCTYCSSKCNSSKNEEWAHEHLFIDSNSHYQAPVLLSSRFLAINFNLILHMFRAVFRSFRKLVKLIRVIFRGGEGIYMAYLAWNGDVTNNSGKWNL